MQRRNCRAEASNAPWPPLIRMDEAVRKKADALFNKNRKL
jgi:hypothetical protein